MKQNQNAVAVIDHKCAVRIKSYVHSRLFRQSLTKLAVVERLFSLLQTCVSGRCHCREVAIGRRFK